VRNSRLERTSVVCRAVYPLKHLKWFELQPGPIIPELTNGRCVRQVSRTNTLSYNGFMPLGAFHNHLAWHGYYLCILKHTPVRLRHNSLSSSLVPALEDIRFGNCGDQGMGVRVTLKLMKFKVLPSPPLTVHFMLATLLPLLRLSRYSAQLNPASSSKVIAPSLCTTLS
jgi:hypothetical protein